MTPVALLLPNTLRSFKLCNPHLASALKVRLPIGFDIGEHIPERNALGLCAAAPANGFSECVHQKRKQQAGKANREKHDLPRPDRAEKRNHLARATGSPAGEKSPQNRGDADTNKNAHSVNAHRSSAPLGAEIIRKK